MTNENNKEVEVDISNDGKIDTDAFLLEMETITGENGQNAQVFKYQKEIEDVSRHFIKKHKYTQDDLDAYLKEHNYPSCTVSDLELLIRERRDYEKQHASTQFVIKQLAKLQSINPFIHTQEQVLNLYKENDKRQFAILDNLSDQGVSYRAMADVLHQARITINGVLQEMENRVVNRMGEIERVALYEIFDGNTDIPFKKADDWLVEVYKKRGLSGVNSNRTGYEDESRRTEGFTKTVDNSAK